MRFVANQSPQKNTISIISRFQRLFFAASIVLGTAAILVAAFANPPITVRNRE